MNPSPTVSVPPSLLPRHKAVIVVLLLAVLVFKCGYIGHRPFNSDESQHLHVAWGWTQGMVQYRDYFDNHTPLFHLLMAPLLKKLGKRADILSYMRVAMVPLWALGCGAIGWLGMRLYSRTTGIFAALLAAACPPLLICGSEFRADILWMALWLLTAATALSGPFSKGRALATGALLGACFGTSMKTTLLVISAFSALGLVLALMQPSQRKQWLSSSLAKLLAFAAGLCLAPLAILGFFAKQDALPALFYCIFAHNLGVPIHQREAWLWILAVGLGLLIVSLALGFRSILKHSIEHSTDWQQDARRLLVLFTPLFFHLYLACFWPLITRQDFLPSIPLLAIPLVGYLMSQRASLPLVGLVAALELATAFEQSKPFHPRGRDSEYLIKDVLSLTHEREPVMDHKGETVFRPRPFYYCLENITSWKLGTGEIPNTIGSEMAATQTCVCVMPKKFPDESRQWIERYYIPITSKLCVAGCRIPPGDGVSPRVFELGVSTRYQLQSADGPVPAIVDGTACTGPVFLESGTHTLICKDPRPLTIMWSRALQKGFKPFHSSL